MTPLGRCRLGSGENARTGVKFTVYEVVDLIVLNKESDHWRIFVKAENFLISC
jgi:hypothetical protein